MSLSVEVPFPSLITRLRNQKEPLTVPEFADILRVSKRSVYYSIKNDNLPVIKIGSSIRIDPVHAAKWLRARQLK
jgi:excisionase family DNA binding protein